MAVAEQGDDSGLSAHGEGAVFAADSSRGSSSQSPDAPSEQDSASSGQNPVTQLMPFVGPPATPAAESTPPSASTPPDTPASPGPPASAPVPASTSASPPATVNRVDSAEPDAPKVRAVARRAAAA